MKLRSLILLVLFVPPTNARGICSATVRDAEAPAVVAAANAPGSGLTQGDPAPRISGSWQLSWTDKDGNPKQATMEIRQNGSKVDGKFHGQRGTFPMTGSLEGDKVSMTVKAKGRQASFTGTVEGDTMSGTTEKGKSWKATRQ